MTTEPLVTSQLVCDVTINRSRPTSATANLGFHSQSSHVICKWWYAFKWMIIRNMYKCCHKSRRNYTFVNLKATKISKRCVYILVTWPWRLTEEWPEACGSLTVVGAGTKHGFGTDPIRNPTIWLVESRNQVNWFAYRGRMLNHWRLVSE